MDSSETMIMKAKNKYPHIHFEVADASNFQLERKFNAIFSNAALHWIKTPEEVLTCFWNALQPKGRFVAEFGGKGNVQRVVQAIITSMEEAGYTFKTEDFPNVRRHIF